MSANPTDDAGGNAPRASGRTVLLPFGGDTAGESLAVAADLATERNDELLVMAADSPADRAASDPAATADSHCEVARQAVRDSPGSDATARVRAVPHAGATVAEAVAGAVDDHDVDVLVVDAAFGAPTRGPVAWTAADRILSKADCDAVVANGVATPGTVASILVPVAGGPHSELAVDVARAIAVRRDAWVDLLHVVDDAGTVDSAPDPVTAAVQRLGDFDQYDTWILGADRVSDAIAEQSRYYDVTVLGAPRKNGLRQFVTGSTASDAREEAEGAVFTVRSRTDSDSGFGGWFIGE